MGSLASPHPAESPRHRSNRPLKAVSHGSDSGSYSCRDCGLNSSSCVYPPDDPESRTHWYRSKSSTPIPQPELVLDVVVKVWEPRLRVLLLCTLLPPLLLICTLLLPRLRLLRLCLSFL